MTQRNDDSSFEWDEDKNLTNSIKHKISFEQAQYAFADANRIIAIDKGNSTKDEKRYYCIGKVKGEIVTVSFTYRDSKIRIISAGYRLKGKIIYEKKN